MLDAGEGPERLRDPIVRDPDRTRGRRRGGGVLAVVLAGDMRLGRKRIVEAELDAPPSPGTRGSKPRGTTATSSALWFSKMRSFAAR